MRKPIDINKIIAQARKQGFDGTKTATCSMCDSNALTYCEITETWICGECLVKIMSAYDKVTEKERKDQERAEKELKQKILKEVSNL